MKVLAICGSPRLGGNTETLIDIACDEIRSAGITAEKITTAGKAILGCTACLKCRKEKDGLCHGRDDDLTPLFGEIFGADGLILGTPVYFGAATAEMTAVIDRVGYVSRQNGGLLKGKIGAPVVVARRAGHNFTVAQLNYFFIINGMVIPGADYWPIAFGGAPKDVLNDAEGVATIKNLASTFASLLLTINSQ